MANVEPIETLLELFDNARHDLRIFMNAVLSTIGEHPDLTMPGKQVVHSFKARLKDRSHLGEKIERKRHDGRDINSGNFFDEITDLAGVRILHLYREDFGAIDSVIRRKIKVGDWHCAEQPKAYTWDPEVVQYFRGFDLDVSEKPSSYTSVHYILKPRADSSISCELQVRTLFEEIWGEVDHQINYPVVNDNVACVEQLKVLSKIVGAGSRLLDALQRVDRLGKAPK